MCQMPLILSMASGMLKMRESVIRSVWAYLMSFDEGFDSVQIVAVIDMYPKYKKV